MLGNSRANRLPADTLGELLDAPTFNFSVGWVTWTGLEERALWVLDACPVRYLVIGLDPSSNRVELYENHFTAAEPPEIAGRGSSRGAGRADSGVVPPSLRRVSARLPGGGLALESVDP